MIKDNNFQICPQCGEISRREYFNDDTEEHSSFCFLCGRRELFYVKRDEWNNVICDMTDYIPLDEIMMYVDLMYIRNSDKKIITSRLIYKDIRDIDNDELQRISASDFPMQEFHTLDLFMEMKSISPEEKKDVLKKYKEKRYTEFAATIAVGLIHINAVPGEYVLDYFRNWKLVEKDNVSYVEHTYPEMNEEYYPGYGVIATKGILIHELELITKDGVDDERMDNLLEKKENLHYITKYEKDKCRLKIIYERDNLLSVALNQSNLAY